MPFMPLQFHRCALIGKYQSPQSREAVLQVAQFVCGKGLEVVLEAATAQSTGIEDYPALSVAQMGTQCDLVIAVGGDGTMLGIGRQMAQYGVPLVGVNQGRLGFITDVPIAELEGVLTPILRGEYEEDARAMIDARVLRDGVEIYRASALNDVVVNRGSTSGMVELRVSVDGMHVADQRADGLIIATPTGASAYALSAGGPLLHPAVGAFIVVPIAPHTLSNRPIGIADSSEISVQVVSGRDVSANFDMQSLASLLHDDRVVMRRSPHRARFLHPRGWNYYATLRTKLHWYEGE
jgi:NAD+ kinase